MEKLAKPVQGDQPVSRDTNNAAEGFERTHQFIVTMHVPAVFFIPADIYALPEEEISEIVTEKAEKQFAKLGFPRATICAMQEVPRKGDAN